MSTTSLKEIFIESNITEDGILEGEILFEQFGPIIDKIIKTQLKKYMVRGQLKIASPVINILKKLNKLGVKKMWGYDLNKFIPAFERYMSSGDDFLDRKEMASMLRKIYGNNKTKNDTRTKQKKLPWLKHRSKMDIKRYSLKSFFEENEHDISAELTEDMVQNPTKMGYNSEDTTEENSSQDRKAHV